MSKNVSLEGSQSLSIHDPVNASHNSLDKQLTTPEATTPLHLQNHQKTKMHNNFLLNNNDYDDSDVENINISNNNILNNQQKVSANTPKLLQSNDLWT